MVKTHETKQMKRKQSTWKIPWFCYLKCLEEQSRSMTNFPSILDSWPGPLHAPSIFILLPSSGSPVYITPTTGQNINISNCPEHSLSKHWLYDGCMEYESGMGKRGLFLTFYVTMTALEHVLACQPCVLKRLLAIMFFPSKGAQGHQNPWEEHA